MLLMQAPSNESSLFSTCFKRDFLISCLSFSHSQRKEKKSANFVAYIRQALTVNTHANFILLLCRKCIIFAFLSSVLYLAILLGSNPCLQKSSLNICMTSCVMTKPPSYKDFQRHGKSANFKELRKFQKI